MNQVNASELDTKGRLSDSPASRDAVPASVPEQGARGSSVLSERERLKKMLLAGDQQFWRELGAMTQRATEFDDLFYLSSLAKKAATRGMSGPLSQAGKLRLAVLGGCSLYPLHELLTHLLAVDGMPCELFLGDYDNFVGEILEADGPLYKFQPQVVVLLPGPQRCKYPGPLTTSREVVQAAADGVAQELLNLCRTVNERSGAEVVLGNFMLPSRRDVGPYRSRTLASDWNFIKWVNLELGLKSPAYVRICDLEFLTNRRGALATEDPRGWFTSKQPGSPALLVDVAREIAQLVLSLRRPPKKVLVLDLDNTLWGGVVAEEGIDGIEIGDTSPRGEAFKAFQKYIRTLKQRGVLLGVCSKNDLPRAMEPFEKHPEMVLRTEDIVSFKANWEPKSDNIRKMAAELNLGLDSFVFVDDNPAEIEIVRQFTPEVTAILLGTDPADYVGQLQDCGLFESHGITGEDAQRTDQYRAEAQRQAMFAAAADMDAYLASLDMEATIHEFRSADVPRLSQLINKSNQFNLTTRRRTEAEVQALIGRDDYVGFSVRLRDRFGDHGLISIAIGRAAGLVMEIDTWIMSCRVLKRQVEELVLNEFARLAAAKGCNRLAGLYLPTAKNEMVREFYPRMGFESVQVSAERGEYSFKIEEFSPRPTKIKILRDSHEPN